MSRVLLLIAILGLVYLLIRSFRKSPPPEEGKPVVDDMVRCAHCGVHLPKRESIQADDQFFCSAEHRNAHRE